MIGINTNQRHLFLRSILKIGVLVFLWLPWLTTQAQQIELAGLYAQAPITWSAQPPQTSMRLAQFKIQAATGDAEAVVFYFGPHQGGTTEANIRRWQSQFSTTQGDVVTPQLARYNINGLQVTEVLFEGHYARGIGTGPVGAGKSDQALLAAIIEGPKGKLFVQLYGPSSTVKANRSEFESFIHSMSPN